MAHGANMSTEAALKNISVLTHLRATAELIWGLLEQGKNCSDNEPPMYSDLCHIWKPPSPAPGLNGLKRELIFESDLRPGSVAQALLNVSIGASMASRVKIDTQLGDVSVRYNNETKFACLALTCK